MICRSLPLCRRVSEVEMHLGKRHSLEERARTHSQWHGYSVRIFAASVHNIPSMTVLSCRKPETFTALARQTSWKFVFKCSIVLQYKVLQQCNHAMLLNPLILAPSNYVRKPATVLHPPQCLCTQYFLTLCFTSL